MNVRRGVRLVILIILSIVAVFPYIWMFVSSIKPANLAYRPEVWQFSPTISSYRTVLIQESFVSYTFNSLFVALATAIISLIVGVLAAYAFVRFLSGSGSRVLLFGYLSAIILPPITLVIPMFFIFFYTNLLGTLTVVVLSHLTFSIPIATWFLIQFIQEVPVELEEAAMLDGDTRLEAVTYIIVPSIKEGLIAVGSLVFIYSWNNFLYPLILAGGRSSRTLPVALTEFDTFQGLLISQMAAAVIITIAPVILLALYMQNYLVSGFGINSGVD